MPVTIVETQEKNSDYHMKSHALVYSSSDLTSHMMNIIALMLTEMKESDWYDEELRGKTPTYRFSSDILCDWFGVSKKSLYVFLKRPSAGLAEKKIGLESEGSFRYRPILSDIQYKKGTLTVVPNPALRDYFLINSSKAKGHAKIDNQIFKSLRHPNSKRVFEFLSRYRFEKHMYDISVSKLQVIFSIKTTSNKILKPSYANERTFVNKIIKPALVEISQNEKAKQKLTIDMSNGGYELTESINGGLKIKLLSTWKSHVTKEQYIEKTNQIVQIMGGLAEAKSTGDDLLPIYTKLDKLLTEVGEIEKATKVRLKIKELTEEKEKQKSEISANNLDEQYEKMQKALNSDLFADL